MAVAAAAALSCHTPSQRAAAQHSRARPFGSLSNGFISSDRMNRNRRGAGRCRPAMKIPVPEIEEMYLKEHLGVDLELIRHVGFDSNAKGSFYDWCLVTISSGWSGKTDATEGYSGSNCDPSTPPTQRYIWFVT
uniref:Uncharacterized protein n=1 Tax=Oryza glumipatula TaxID=40148 RepID=A0A0D9YPF7_9ORYZ